MAATGCFASYIPVKLFPNVKWSGAGLVGTVIALICLPLLPEKPFFLLTFLLMFAVAAVWISSAAEKQFKTHDDPRIIIDEIIGFWIASAFIPHKPAAIASAFVCFRLFDSFKPFFISRLDALPGGFGIVIDDVASGIAANILVRLGLFLLQ